MKCTSWIGSVCMASEAPILCTPNLPRLLAFYREAAGFACEQDIHGVFAGLRHGALRLHLWGRRDALPLAHSRITLERGDPCIFHLHRQLARSCAALLDARAPRLQAWGAWTFELTDIDGNRLEFISWPAPSAGPARGEAERSGLAPRGTSG